MKPVLPNWCGCDSAVGVTRILRTARVRAYQLCRAYPRHHMDPEDVTQELATAILARLNSYDPSRASLATFAEAVAAHHVISLVRQWRAAKRCAIRVPIAECCLVSEHSDLCADVWRVLARVPDNDRDLAILLMQHGPTEVSRCTGSSRAAVYRGIQRLRAAFVAAGLGSAR